MAKRQLDKLIDEIDAEIAVLQHARNRLVRERDEQDAKKAKTKKANAAPEQ